MGVLWDVFNRLEALHSPRRSGEGGQAGSQWNITANPGNPSGGSPANPVRGCHEPMKENIKMKPV